MSQEVRSRILVLLEQHSRSGSPTFVGDAELSAATGLPVEETRRQMDILESQELTRTANSHDGRRARISPSGILAVEGLIEAASQAEDRPIGFKPDDSEERTGDRARR